MKNNEKHSKSSKVVGTPTLNTNSKSSNTQEDLPTLAEAMKAVMTDGTVYQLPTFKITLPKEDKRSASVVNELEVEIISEETRDQQIMHKLYTGTLRKIKSKS